MVSFGVLEAVWGGSGTTLSQGPSKPQNYHFVASNLAPDFGVFLVFFSHRVHVFFRYALCMAFWLPLRSESVEMSPSG